MQKAQAGQIACGSLHPVVFGEVRRPCGDFPHQFGNDQVGRVNRQDVDQDDALIADVFGGGGGRDVLIARPFRVVLHRKVRPLSAPHRNTPRPFLEQGDAMAKKRREYSAAELAKRADKLERR